MSPDNRTILLVEDDAIMGASLHQRLSLEGFATEWLTNGAAANAYLAQHKPDLVVCDIRLPDMTGEDVFLDRQKAETSPPFLFITAFGDIEQAVRLVKAGAGDYLTKPFDMSVFLDRVDDLMASRPVSAASETLGPSPAMRHVQALIDRCADLSTPLLFVGETGVGKEVCAAYLHQVSGGKDHPFIAVNCSAIPRDLMESELFGHEKGAFSGAVRRHVGYAERAANGILFLDEISELQAELQAKLLRLVENRTFSRVGGETSLPFNGRIVCASNVDLDKAVETGAFRADLFFRINVVRIDVPPLRSRREDIQPLLARFVQECANQWGRPVPRVSSLAETMALEHDWPGNVRELRNRVERAVALADGDLIMPCDLFPDRCPKPTVAIDHEVAPLADVRDAAERRQIARALQVTDGQIAKAATLLGVSRTTLWEKMKRHDILAEHRE